MKAVRKECAQVHVDKNQMVFIEYSTKNLTERVKFQDGDKILHKYHLKSSYT